MSQPTDIIQVIRRPHLRMKVRCFFIGWILICFQVRSQVHYMDTVQFILAGVKVPDHPRILLLKGEEKYIQQNIHSNRIWGQLHASMIHRCDSLLNLPTPERVLTGIRLLYVSRDCLFRLFHLSYAWRMTHDRKYFDRAEKELLAVCRFSDWHPQHYLDVAEMTTGVAIGYDWLYNDLSPGSRKLIREAILTKGVLTSYDTAYPSYRKWLSVTNNWNQVCNTGISFGALSIFEDDPSLAIKVINRSVASIDIPMKDCEPDGAFAEGYTYWGYGTTFNVLFLSAIEKIFKTDFGLGEQKGFLKTAAYLENMIAPSGKCFNYSDATEPSILQPAMFWFAKKEKDPSLLWKERDFLVSDSSIRTISDRLLPAIMIWGSGINMHDIREPKNRIWIGAGKNPVALIRTSWSDPAALYVGLKGGSPSVTHGHMDAGSFVMEADGVRWSMDLGMQDYTSLETKNVDLWSNGQDGQRWEVFRYRNDAHSTLTINNQLQRVDGYAAVSGSSKNPDFLEATTDISSLYKGQLISANRGIAICDKKYVLVRDEIETSDTITTVRWSMLTAAGVKITGANSAELDRNGRKLTIIVKGTNKVEMKTWATNPPPHDYDESNQGTATVGFEAHIPANSKASFNVFLLPGNIQADTKKNVLPLQQWSK